MARMAGLNMVAKKETPGLVGIVTELISYSVKIILKCIHEPSGSIRMGNFLDI
jgi:hypothetical protein